MAKSPTAQIQELALELRTVIERIETLTRDATDSARECTELRSTAERTRDDHAALRQEIALLRQRFDDQAKRTETWANRAWGFFVVLVGALLSLASGLIVTLARK